MAVYFIQSGESGHIKIGYTAGNPLARLSALQTGNPDRLRLLVSIPGDAATERDLHTRFAELRTGGEWFRCTPEMLGFIDAMKWERRNDPPISPTDPDAASKYGFNRDQIEFIRGMSLVASDRARIEMLLNMLERASPGDVDTPEVILCELRAYRLNMATWLDAAKADGPFGDGASFGMGQGVFVDMLTRTQRALRSWDRYLPRPSAAIDRDDADDIHDRDPEDTY